MQHATALALLRGLHLAATLSMLGVVGFVTWVLPAAMADAGGMRIKLVRLWRISGITALLLGAAWFVLQSATIASATSLAEVAVVLPVVAQHTRYGSVMMVRMGLLLVATLLAGHTRLRLYLTLGMLVVALGLQGLIGHAGAMGGEVGAGIVASEALHLLAAGLWLGALLPLWLSIGRLWEPAAAAICERFSPLGLGCVLVIAGTGLAQGLELIGSLPALLGTQYGQIALLKIALFLIILALAALNRLWLTDRLSRSDVTARSCLRLSVAAEASIGLAIILAAGFLASSVPAEHEPPVWPFSWQFSLVSIQEDPDLRTEVIVSLGLIGLAILAQALAVLLGRFRIVALVLLVGILAWRTPSLGLLTVQAYPTSFQTSPTGFSAASIERGQVVYRENCVGCHGATGAGNGPLAAGRSIKPADLTAPHLWAHSDGELFWWLTHGIDDPEGGLAMPGFAALPEADRWALIDYVRAHNAGLAMLRNAPLGVPVAAPSLPIHCAGSTASGTADLRGHVVHAVADGTADELTPIPPQAGISIVMLELRTDDADRLEPPAGSCVAATPAAWQAYAVLAGVSPDKLAGTEFLIDPDGWLRAVHVRGSPAGWQTHDGLIAAIQSICATPIHHSNRGEHEHHH